MPGGFHGLGVIPPLIKATEDLNYKFPTNVQDEAIPLMLGGRDVMVSAETGSGKTAAFGIPIVQIVAEEREQEKRMNENSTASNESKSKENVPILLSTLDRSPVTAVDSSGLVCQARNPRGWGGVRCTAGVLKGKYCFEAKVNDGLCRVGWSTLAARFDLGYDKHGFGYGGTAKKATQKNFQDYGEVYDAGDVITCYLDMDSGEISFSRNGKWLGVAFSLPKKFKGPVYPALCLKNAEISVNFGAKPWMFPIEKGFKGLSSGNRAEIENRPNINSLRGQSNLKSKKNIPLAIVLAPTKELAEQIFEDLKSFAKYIGALQTVLVMGGVHKSAMNALKSGCDIVVGTPGLVYDFIKRGILDTSCIRLFLLDEADRMCDREGRETISKIFQRLPKNCTSNSNAKLQVCFFSATLHSSEITSLANTICHRPVWVDLKGGVKGAKSSIPETVHHVVIPVDPIHDSSLSKQWNCRIPKELKTDGVHNADKTNPSNHSPESFSQGIKRLKPLLLKQLVDKMNMAQCLIFCRTNLDCDNLESYLTSVGGGRKFRADSLGGKENEYSCAVLAGMRSMEQRRENLKAFKNGQVRFLIATDVAARGIDIKELPYVINMTLPDQIENYIHRIGRVGRAETMGLAISFVATKREKVWYYDKKKWKNRKLSTELAVVDKYGAPKSGGCCIWYDEPKLLVGVEKRLGCKISRMNAGTLELPKQISDAIKNGVCFGEQNDPTAGATGLSKQHIKLLKPTVSSLTKLEVDAQLSYHSLISNFGM
eukprot:g1199.t1